MSTPEKKAFWLIKFAPFRTSWAEIVKRGAFTMRGVRNHLARNHLAAMRVGDQALFYHSQQERAVVGVCEVERQAFPDPTAGDSRWLAVSLRPIRTLANPVSLACIKSIRELDGIGLVRQPRLSVMPLAESEFKAIIALSEGP